MTEQTAEPVLNAFAPIGATDARLMILGSMPGAISLAQTEYYAHPRNAFWPVIQALFGGSIKTYSEKCQILTNNQIVVWDVLTQCVRPGSLDSNIRRDSVVCNDFAALLGAQSGVSRIAFNGKAAEQLFRKHALPTLNIQFISNSDSGPRQRQQDPTTTRRTIQLLSLPSTSPAMAALKLDDKIVAWSKALSQAAENTRGADNQV